MICRKCQMPLNGNEACNFCRSEYERIKQKNHEKSAGVKAGPVYYRGLYFVGGNSRRGSS